VSAANEARLEGLSERHLEPLLGIRYEDACRSVGPAAGLSTEKVIEYLDATKPHASSGDAARSIEDLALIMLEGTITSDRAVDVSERMSFLNGWLRFVTGNLPLFRMRWAALAKSTCGKVNDRDSYALALWQRIATDPSGEGGLPTYAKQHWGPWDYYERHFFSWFLGRFDLFKARCMFGASAAAPRLNLILLPVCLALAACALQRGPDVGRSCLALAAGAAFLIAAGCALRLPAYAYLNSLIPRLAATVGIGYLFLVNAPQVARFVCLLPRWRSLWLAAAMLLLTALAYIMIHIARRVDPPLRLRPLLLRSLDLWALAVSYAMLGLVGAAPVLFSTAVMESQVAVQPRHLALVAAVALNLGVILQLAWDEKPLTEPL
jgi:hypothetical protein